MTSTGLVLALALVLAVVPVVLLAVRVTTIVDGPLPDASLVSVAVEVVPTEKDSLLLAIVEVSISRVLFALAGVVDVWIVMTSLFVAEMEVDTMMGMVVCFAVVRL